MKINNNIWLDTRILDVFQMCVIIIFGVLSFLLMKDVGLIGDEAAYARSSKALVGYFHGVIGGAELAKHFYDHGWFMPGMAVFLTPISYFFYDSEHLDSAYRAWVMIWNCILIWLIMHNLQSHYGSRKASLLFLSVFLVPYFVVYMSAIWADLISCLLLILVILKFKQHAITGKLRYFLMLGAGLSAVIYLRAPYSAFLAIVFFIVLLDRRATKRTLKLSKGILLSVFICVLTILPWSYGVSKHTGIDTFTVTSLKLSKIVGFGDFRYRVALAKEGGMRNQFLSIDRAVRQRAIKNNVSVIQQYDEELDRSTIGLTTEKYKAAVARNIKSYLAQPTGFFRLFTKRSCDNGGLLCEVAESTNWDVERYNDWISYLFFSAAIMLMIVPFRVNCDTLVSVFFKASFFLYLLIPFIAYVHGRYLIQVFPIAALALSMLVAQRKDLRNIVGFEFDDVRSIIVSGGQALAIFSVLAYLWAIM